MEYKEYASKGVAGTGLGLGIAGTALGVLNGGGALCNLFGGNRVGNAATDMAAMMAVANAAPRATACTCSEDHTINRYEAGQSARIAELEDRGQAARCQHLHRQQDAGHVQVHRRQIARRRGSADSAGGLQRHQQRPDRLPARAGRGAPGHDQDGHSGQQHLPAADAAL